MDKNIDQTSARLRSPEISAGRLALIGLTAGLALGGAFGLALGTAVAVPIGLLGAVAVALALLLREARRKVTASQAQLEAERARAASIEARDRAFFERLSQEFRTPLTLILAGFRALQEDRESPVRVRREVAAAGLRNTARLLLVLHELGALASSDAGRRAPRKRVTDLAALIRRVAGNFSASGAGRSLTLNGTDAPAPVDVDPHQIQTVLYAILSNAFQRTDPVTGHVELSLIMTEQDARLELRDDGGQIASEQSLEETVTSRGGPGLGLAVVREILAGHQGDLRAEPSAGGLAVFLRIPRGDASGPPAPFLDESTEVLDFLHRLARPNLSDEDAPTEEADGPLDPSLPLLMVIAANADLRTWIRSVLSARYAVATAPGLAEARERAHQVRPELLVVDADPPDEHSLGLVAEIRRDPVLCATPILGVLGRTMARGEADPHGLAADDYLPLPFEADELLARVSNLVRSRTQADENQALRRQLEARVEDQIHELVRTGQLRRFLPQALLDGALRRQQELEEEEDDYDRRWITVISCTLRGFGDLVERMDPGDLARLLNTWAREATAEALVHGGVVDQHFGDALVIVFGAPESMKAPEQANAAVRAALAIDQKTRELAEHWHRYGLPRGLELRSGIHTGIGLVGVLGSELTARYTAFGPAALVASRLAQESSNPGILASLATYAHVRALVDGGQACTVPVEGLSRPVECYAIRGLKGDQPA